MKRSFPRKSAALFAATMIGLVACTPPTPLPPVAAVGDPIIGKNPVPARTPGAKVTTISYGPWTVPGATGTGHHGAGMKEDVKLYNVQRPCTDCYITAATPRLTYLDGTTANTDAGLWLHHFALFSSGGVDTRCSNTLAALVGEVFFTGANERTSAFSPAGTGYRTGPWDAWSLLVDLMNTSPTAKDLKFEVTYEWVPASTPNMHAIRPIILDAGVACTNSEVPAGTGQYSRKSTWTATLPGRVIGLASHMHDGGSKLVVRNLTNGQLICDSKMYYGGPGYQEPAGPAGHSHSGINHLSGVDQCIARGVDRPVALIGRGDQIEIEAFYDGDAHPHDPTEPVMGLAFMFVVPEER
jgi:hypothetical protein